MKQLPKQKTMADTEREKGARMMADLVKRLIEHEEDHTPFLDRWANLFVEHETAIYAVEVQGGAVGRRLRHGKPSRAIELLESALPLGKPGVWFAKIIA